MAAAQQLLCNAARKADPMNRGSPPECDEMFALRPLMDAKNAECATLPVTCMGRGACDLGSGTCNCTGNHMPPDCASEPLCRYWDANTSSWQSGGVAMQSFDRLTGGVVCATGHLTDFAVVSDNMLSADIFAEVDVELSVNLPKPLTLEELLAILADIEAPEYVGIALSIFGALGLMWLAGKYDDRRSYVEFFPRWHQRLGGSSSNMAFRAVGSQLIILLTSNVYFAIFFVLPSMPVRRSQRLMTVYIVVLAQFAVLIMFHGGQKNELTAFIAQAICGGILIFFKLVSTKSFNSAMIPRKLLAVEHPTMLQRRDLQRRKGPWDIVLRQTVLPYPCPLASLSLHSHCTLTALSHSHTLTALPLPSHCTLTALSGAG